MKKCSILLALLCFSINAQAIQHREHQAHVHGKAKLDIAIENDTIEANLDIPGMDLVGFETKAKTDKQKKTVEKIKNTFSKDYNLFLIPDDAGCTVSERKLDQDETKDHTEYKYTIKYKCKDISKINELDANLFRDIDTLKEVTVTVVTDTIQKELKIYPTKSKISVKE